MNINQLRERKLAIQTELAQINAKLCEATVIGWLLIKSSRNSEIITIGTEGFDGKIRRQPFDIDVRDDEFVVLLFDGYRQTIEVGKPVRCSAVSNGKSEDFVFTLFATRAEAEAALSV